jgi:hypothetical protein
MKRILILLLAHHAPLALAAPSTIQPGSSYAWDANTGWIEFIPNTPNAGDGVVVADSVVSGYAWNANTGWINFGDGTPANGIHYANTDGSDCGVNHDGAGNLTGLAWSANTGWINFGWWTSDPADPNRPHFDISDGQFSGYAWSANTGWLNLGTGLLKVETILIIDSDGDGIADSWEMEHAGNLVDLGADNDADGDGISDPAEFCADTDPFDPNSFLRITEFVKGELSSELTWTSSPARLYHIAQSVNLTDWTAGNLLAPDPGDFTTRTANHPADDKRFFRVGCAMPLQP